MTQKTTTDVRIGPSEVAAVETSKHRLSRDFLRRSILDFYNSILLKKSRGGRQRAVQGRGMLHRHQ